MGRWLNRVSNPNQPDATTEPEQEPGSSCIDPTEPTKAPSVGFVGSVSRDTPKSISIEQAITWATEREIIHPLRLWDELHSDDIADIEAGVVSISQLKEYGRILAERIPHPRDRKRETREQIEARQPRHIHTWVKPRQPPASLWPAEHRAVRDKFHNHIMECVYCYAPRQRYCSEGSRLRERYHETAARLMCGH